MRFQDWGQLVREQQKRLAAIQLGTARESICLDGKTIVVELTATNGKVQISDPGAGTDKEVTISDVASKWSDPRMGLSELFRRYQYEYTSLLEDVTKQVDQLVDSFTKLYSMIVEKDIPELVMRRIAGDGGSAVGQYQCVQEVGNARMTKQVDDLAAKLPLTIRMGWTEEISGKNIVIDATETELKVAWGEFQAIKRWGHATNLGTISLNQTLLYLANFDALQTALDKFARAARVAKKVLDGWTKEIIEIE